MASTSSFNNKTTASLVAKAYHKYIKGKTNAVLITGISPTSIGADTAYALAAGKPAIVILASRTKKNIDVVANTIMACHPSVAVMPLIVDLSSQDSVRSAAVTVNNSIAKLDLLICNAGIMAIPTRTLSPDGLELQFATNHIGHFLLTNLLLGKLRAAAAEAEIPGTTRVVLVSSNGHHFSPVRFHDYNFEGKQVPEEEEPLARAMIDRGVGEPHFDSDFYNKFVAYGQSKSANILFTLQLREKLARDGIQAVAVHPGTIGTTLVRHYSTSVIISSFTRYFLMLAGMFGLGGFKTTDAGAATTMVGALDPKLSALKGTDGLYLSDYQFGEALPHASNTDAAEKLWALSEKLVKGKFPI